MVCKSRQCRRRGPMLAPLPLRTAVRFDSLRQSMSDAVLLIPSCYNVLALLRHAHRAMLIFPTLTYDEFDPASEARNQLLLDTVHHELVAAHDVSFNPSEDLDDLWSLIAHDPTVDLRDFPWLTDLTSRKSSLASLEDVYRCPRIVVYVKRVSDWRIIITIVPVGVEDLLQLSNGGKRRRTLSLPLFLFNCYEPLLASGLAAADVLSETSPPPVATYFEDHRKSVDASILARLNRQVSRLGHTESSTPSLLNLEPHWFARGRDRGVSEAMMDMDADCDLDFNFIGYCGRFDELLFSRAFVGGVYRCLCEGVYVPKEDILQATDDRCDQFNIEIDSVTQSLNLLCSHFQQYSKTVQDEGINRCYSIDTERSTFSGTSQSGPQTDPHPAFRTPSCAGEHEDLRAAFHRLLDEHFRPVPNLPTHYYYVPGPSSLQYPLAAVMNTAVKGLLQPLPTTESEGGDWSRESTDDVSQLTSPTGGPPAEQTIEFVRMTDDESRSEKSAIDDESPSSPSTSSTATSISESLDEPLTCADDLCPLFLQLSCAVRLPNNEMCTFAVDDPPACLADLFAQCGDELEGVWDYDLRNVQVTLDLYLLTTFPTMGPIDLLEAKIPTSPLSEKSPVPSPGLPVGEGVHFTWNCDDDIMSFSAPTAQLSELPEKERVVVEKLKSGVEKLMRIERIFAVTRMDADRVTADALADIITYIEQEANTNDDKRLNGHGVLIGQTPLTLV
uniref:Uncharacterized protein n=1 Tax=Plectus sambesii TaxID=2011161 RepID=A0A914XD51_9BILA